MQTGAISKYWQTMLFEAEDIIPSGMARLYLAWRERDARESERAMKKLTKK